MIKVILFPDYCHPFGSTCAIGSLLLRDCAIPTGWPGSLVLNINQIISAVYYPHIALNNREKEIRERTPTVLIRPDASYPDLFLIVAKRGSGLPLIPS